MRHVVHRLWYVISRHCKKLDLLSSCKEIHSHRTDAKTVTLGGSIQSLRSGGNHAIQLEIKWIDQWSMSKKKNVSRWERVLRRIGNNTVNRKFRSTAQNLVMAFESKRISHVNIDDVVYFIFIFLYSENRTIRSQLQNLLRARATLDLQVSGPKLNPRTVAPSHRDPSYYVFTLHTRVCQVHVHIKSIP